MRRVAVVAGIVAALALGGDVVWAGQAEPPAAAGELVLDLGNKVTMKLVLVPAGKFLMGSPEDEKGRNRWDNRETQHEVTISKPFYAGVCEVTRGQFTTFVKDFGYRSPVEMGDGRIEFVTPWDKPGYDQTDEHPVVCVSWNDAMEFCEWLSKKSGRTVSLPTEAQWEYACRAGTKTAYHWGDDPEGGKGWCNGGDQALARFVKAPRWSGFQWDDGFAFTAPVGKFKPNAFGLYDMHGNACEWCSDWYGLLGKEPQTDPIGPAKGEGRVVRGGGRDSAPSNCRSASRNSERPRLRTIDHGFRVVAEAR